MTTITNNKLTDEQRWCPDVDPITRYPLFMWINHPELGYVPTYGGPYDSYTLTERDENGEFYRHRYDHDRGGWVEDEYVGLIVVEDWLPKDQVELDEYVQDNPTAELQERRKADNQEPAGYHVIKECGKVGCSVATLEEAEKTRDFWNKKWTIRPYFYSAPPVQETGAITESDAAHHAWNACHTAMLKRGYQMTAITKEWLQQTIAEFENTRDDIPFGLNDDDAKILIVLKRALAVIDAEPVRYLNKFSGTCVTLEQQSNAADDVAVYMPLYAAPPAPVVPDDWRLVPKNPTGPMLAAGYQAYMKGQHRGRFYRSYQAMLEAAPKLSEVDRE